jgi:hypothetical protein
MAKVKIEANKRAYQDLLTSREIVNHLVNIGEKVKDEAVSTASSAEEGAGGTIDGYASAGFDVVINRGRNQRPQIRVVSYADTKTYLAAYFHTIKRDGIAHMRAALRKVTR